VQCIGRSRCERDVPGIGVPAFGAGCQRTARALGGFDHADPPDRRHRGQRRGDLPAVPGSRYPARAHVVSVVLTDAATGGLVAQDYRAQTATTSGVGGQLRTVVLRLPAGDSLPADVRATVVTDGFPLRAQDFPT